MNICLPRVLAFLALLFLALTGRGAVAEVIILQSTTSTQNSGLLEDILPRFTQSSGHAVHVVAVGTGQAIKNARNGDGDVLLVHSRADEEKFVAEGWGVERLDLMYNDFVIIGPDSDPAGIRGGKDAVEALRKIAQEQLPFISRGDDSGTHKAEMRLWAKGGIDVVSSSGTWYREAGAGMGATLNIAAETGAYVLSDRGTWISFGRKQGHAVLMEGDPQLFNQYGVILVNSERHPSVATTAGQALIDWLTGEQGQAEIAGYRVNGEQLFFPNAGGSSK